MSQSFAEALSWVPVSATLSQTLGRAHEYARAQAYRTVTLEHLLLALAEDPDASQVLLASGIDIGRLRSDASSHLGHSEDRIAPGQPNDPAADEALVRILDYAAAAARQSRRREINGAIVLAAIVGEGNSVAASMLQSHGLTFEGAIKALQRSQTPQAPRQQLPPPAASMPMQLPVPQRPSAAADPIVVNNGVATQTNEQILANVRRRIDATRHQPKPNPALPAREPYPAPPGTTPQAKPKSVQTELPQAPLPAPSPTPAPAPVSTAPPSEAVAPPAAEYTGLHPEPATANEPVDAAKAPTPAPAAAPQPDAGDGPIQESMGWQQPGASMEPVEVKPPPRRPPPLPPAPAAGASPLAEPPPSPLRPRQLGAPVVPPSSVIWPAPVEPQPNALPPARPLQSIRPVQPLDPYSFDGGIAGAPFPEPDSVPPAPANIPVPVQRTKVPKAQPQRPSASPIEPGQLAENIPRTMQVGKVETVEVRIAKANIRSVTDGMQGSAQSYLHELIVTKAMSVRLRAPDGGFSIETGSPETQWLDNNLGMQPDDFASWRWNVTPLRRGASRLQLVVSARTIASDGLTADTALPDQVFDVRVKADYARMALRAAGWVGLMILGGVLSKFGQNGFETVATLWRGFE